MSCCSGAVSGESSTVSLLFSVAAAAAADGALASVSRLVLIGEGSATVTAAITASRNCEAKASSPNNSGCEMADNAARVSRPYHLCRPVGRHRQLTASRAKLHPLSEHLVGVVEGRAVPSNPRVTTSACRSSDSRVRTRDGCPIPPECRRPRARAPLRPPCAWSRGRLPNRNRRPIDWIYTLRVFSEV